MNFQSFDFIKFLFILYSFVSILKSDDEILCENLSSLETYPLECCIYPQFIDDLSEVTYKCSALCKALPSPPFYCLKNCRISESGVIVRGKFNGSKAVKLFYEGEYEDPTTLSEKWTKVVKNSAKICEKEVPTDSDINSNDYNYFYTKFIECIRMENFLNCPDFSSSINCKKIKELMTKCDESNYPLLHEFFFEDFYYRNNTNVTLKWTTRTTSLGTPYPTEKTTTEEATTEDVETEEASTEEITTKGVTTNAVNSTEKVEATKAAEMRAIPVNKSIIIPATQIPTKPVTLNKPVTAATSFSTQRNPGNESTISSNVTNKRT